MENPKTKSLLFTTVILLVVAICVSGVYDFRNALGSFPNFRTTAVVQAQSPGGYNEIQNLNSVIEMRTYISQAD